MENKHKQSFELHTVTQENGQEKYDNILHHVYPCLDIPGCRMFDEGEWKASARDSPQALLARCS